MPPDILTALQHAARPIDDVFAMIGDARVVLIGEATHGTQEFYEFRAALTLQLVEQRGVRAVALEGDIPDTSLLHRYITGDLGDDLDAAFTGFNQFPTWMWRNEVVRDFAARLRARNERVEPQARAGVFGLDLYSLRASMSAVVAYLESIDPAQAADVAERYACFDRFDRDAQMYGALTAFGEETDCRAAVDAALAQIEKIAPIAGSRDGVATADEAFLSAANARVAADAEAYYRSMFGDDTSSWNVRDRHMDDALARVRAHLRATRDTDKVVVWAHNSHLGDARATSMGAAGDVSLGQLARERADGEVVTVGLLTYDGTVTAAKRWGDAPRTMKVRPAADDSYEALFHAVGTATFACDLRDPDVAVALAGPRTERAIGVIYRPRSERRSHYLEAVLPRQFDIVVFIDRTNALRPLPAPDIDVRQRELETFPSGI